MWRDKIAYTETRLSIDALKHGDTGTLAIRATDGDDAIRRLLQREHGHDRLDSLETEINFFRVQRFQPAEPVLHR